MTRSTLVKESKVDEFLKQTSCSASFFIVPNNSSKDVSSKYESCNFFLICFSNSDFIWSSLLVSTSSTCFCELNHSFYLFVETFKKKFHTFSQNSRIFPNFREKKIIQNYLNFLLFSYQLKVITRNSSRFSSFCFSKPANLSAMFWSNLFFRTSWSSWAFGFSWN